MILEKEMVDKIILKITKPLVLELNEEV